MKISNEKGFITVLSLALLPLIITVVAVGYAAFLIMKNQGEALHTCRVELLDSQEKVARNLKDLMDLNPEAKELRLQLQAAESMLAAAVLPPALAAAEAAIAETEAEQAALALRQRSLILAAQLESRLAPQRTYQSINGKLQESERNQTDHGAVSYAFPTYLESASFDVVAEPESSTTPDYNPSTTFSDEQTMKVGIRIAIENLLPKWLAMIVHSSGLDIKAACSATLEKEGGSWSPTLKAVKLSSN